MLRSRQPRELPIAFIPVVFALQQFIEGRLWVAGPADVGAGSLTQAFLVLALIFWPVFSPAAALAIETEPPRRRLIAACLAVGAGVAAYFSWQLLAFPHTARVVDGHLQYDVVNTPVFVGGLYVVATTLPLLLSSVPAVGLLGLVVLTGSIATYAAYDQAFISVWCFFAAAGSVVVAGHFEWERRRPVRAA
ncbi:MAG: hypothetical protein KBA31_07845 [Alphaproteobacteria bacterium]|nr:hypothetical protein [Alphaproteobacteria bacterium]